MLSVIAAEVWKEFLTMYLAICAASGKEFFGRKVKPCPVIMVDQENNRALNKWRMLAVGRGLDLSRSLPDLPIMPLFFENINLADDASIERLKRYISDFKPGLITVDTLIRCTRGWEEDKSGDINKLDAVINELKYDTGQDFVFLLLCHTTKDKEATGQMRVRGSGDIAAIVDHGFIVEKTKALNGLETFGLTEPSPRHGTGSEFQYRLSVSETGGIVKVNFNELTGTAEPKGESGDESEPRSKLLGQKKSD